MIKFKDEVGNCWILARPGSLSTSTVFWHWGETSHFYNKLPLKAYR